MMMVVLVAMIIAVGVVEAVMVPMIVVMGQRRLDSPEKEKGKEDGRDHQKLAYSVEYNRFHDCQNKAVGGPA